MQSPPVCQAQSEYAKHGDTEGKSLAILHLFSVREEEEIVLGTCDAATNEIHPIHLLTDSSVHPPSALQELRVDCACPCELVHPTPSGRNVSGHIGEGVPMGVGKNNKDEKFYDEFLNR